MQIPWKIRRVEPESGYIIDGIIRTIVKNDADRDEVDGAIQGLSQPNVPLEVIAGIFRTVRLFKFATVHDHRCIIENGGSRQPVLQGACIVKRFEVGAGLPPRLSRMVEFFSAEIKASDNRTDSAIVGIKSNQGSLDGRLLAKCQGTVR